MKTNISRPLLKMLQDTAKETELARSKESFKRLKQKIKDAPPVVSFADALAAGPALIAEIKRRSPSQGAMLPHNVSEAPYAYKNSRVVKAISVLTNRTQFGMKLDDLSRAKGSSSKPVLRKDFITEEYHVYQSRAYGADAVLLMANILDRDELRRLSDLAIELGMDVLFETHRVSEVADIPSSAKIIGINCRNFDTAFGFGIARLLRQWMVGVESDRSVSRSRFEYADQLPPHVIRVAESGVTAANCVDVFSMGFHAALVGTFLLMDKRGIITALSDFQQAMRELKPPAKDPLPARQPKPILA